MGKPTGIGSRTIRSDLDGLRDYLRENGLEVTREERHLRHDRLPVFVQISLISMPLQLPEGSKEKQH